MSLHFKTLANKGGKYFKVNADDNVENVFKNILIELKKRKNI